MVRSLILRERHLAKLKVQFFWPFKAKYWIIDLTDNYRYAVVSHPNKFFL